MNSRPLMSGDRRPSIPHIRRYVWGKVIQQEGDVLHFELEPQTLELDASQQPRWARVRKEDWPTGRTAEHYQMRKQERLFLVQPTSEDGHLWHASLAWATEDLNPWNLDAPDHLLRGATVTGTVARYVGDYAAVVALDDNHVEAFLHRAQTPEPLLAIQESLHIGDRVQAVLMHEGTDFERLMAAVSVNEAIEREKNDFFERYLIRQQDQEATGHQTHDPWIEYSTASGTPPFDGVTVLVVEHEGSYAKQLTDLLEGMGAKVMASTNHAHAKILLSGKTSFSHVVSDYQMGTGSQRREWFEVLRRSRLPVALMSGDSGAAGDEAQRHGWAMLCKPVSFAHLNHWFVKGTSPYIVRLGAELSDAWSLGVEGKATLRRAKPALAQFCQATGALAACWVRQQREGVFATLGGVGFPNGIPAQIEAQFGTTMVANVIGTRQPAVRAATHAGALELLADVVGATSVWCMPVAESGLNDETIVDALLVFTPGAYARHATLPDGWETHLTHLSERLLDLSDMALLAERLRESESFATLGRVNGALLHEIKQTLQGFETYVPLLAKHLHRGETSKVQQDLKELTDTKDRIARLTRTNLYNLQKSRREEVALQQRLPEILSWFEPVFQRHEWLLRCELPKSDSITAFVPPEVVEQPLVNLLDNAQAHLRPEWGEVRVTLLRAHWDLACPIHIEVRDLGKGMSAEQLDHLFTPRISSKGAKGYGLGLYTSRQLLRAIGGDLEVIRPACFRWLGSGFRIRLPDTVRNDETKDAP